MHLFDIRRSNSVTELWKKFQYPSLSENARDPGAYGAASPKVADPASSHGGEGSNSNAANVASAENDGPQPFLEAFEAEMSKLLNSPEDPEVQLPQQGRSSAEAQSETSSGNRQNPADAFAQAIHNIIDGAAMVRDGLRSRLPEVQRQLHNAQQALPENVGTSLRVAFMDLEGQVRNLTSALNNVSVPGQRSDATQPSVATCTVDCLREMAYDVGHLGQSLFAEFERELRSGQPNASNQATSGTTPVPSSTGNQEPTAAANMPAPNSTVYPAAAAEQSHPNGASENQRDLSTSDAAGDAKPRTQPIESVEGRNVAPSNLLQQVRRLYPEDATPNTYQHPANVRSRQPSHNRRVSPPPLPNPLFQAPYAPPFRPPPPPFQAPSSQAPPYQAPPFQALPFRAPPFQDPPSQAPPILSAPPAPTVPPFPLDFLYFPHHVRNPPFNPPVPGHLPIPPSLHANKPEQRVHPPPSAHRRDLCARQSPDNGGDEASIGNVNHPSQELPGSPTHRLANQTLFIGNVGFNVSTSMIRNVFASKGFLVDVDLPLDSQTGNHAGFGYLRFASVHAAKAALEALQGTLIDGHSVNLEFSDNSPIGTMHRGAQGTPQQGSNDPKAVSTSQDENASGTRNSIGASGQPKKPCLKERNGKGKGKGKEPSSSGDRKSLSFTEPSASLSHRPHRSSFGSGNSVGGSQKTPPGMGALLDQDTADSAFSARYPSLLPDNSANRPSFGATPSHPIRLSPELEMRRFPPISQLDAHAMASQGGEARPTAANSSHETKPSEEKHEGEKAAPPAAPGALPQASQNIVGMEDNSKRDTLGQGYQGLRRSNTVMPVNPSARLTGPFNPQFQPHSDSRNTPLRRRATERQSLQERARENSQPLVSWDVPAGQTSEWTRPLGFSRSRSHRALRRDPFNKPLNPRRETGTSASVVDSGGPDRNGGQPSINDCVATLHRMGYGGVRDGGDARIRMYAEVACGNVLEAIEMIEEERKAYESQRWH